MHHTIAALGVVLSLFDYTGEAVRPWAEAGFDCHCYDLQHEGTRRETVGLGSITFHRWDAEQGIAEIAKQHERSAVRMVFSFAPCTDMATSGAKHFERKLARDPDIQQRAMRWARLAEDLAGRLGAPYMVENPRSVLSTLWRKPNYTFDPCDYGGYLGVDEPHPRWPDLIPPQDAYTKFTCLWTSDNFIMPEADPVEPVTVEKVLKNGKVTRSSPMWAKLGGKSLKTKNIRSATPRGFARAVFHANAGTALAQEVAAWPISTTQTPTDTAGSTAG